MLVNLLRARPGLVTDEMVHQLELQLAKMQLVEDISQRQKDASDIIYGYDIYSKANCGNANLTEYGNDPCSFLLLLNAIRETFPFNLAKSESHYEVILSYASQVLIDKTPISKLEKTVGGMKAWIEEHYQVEIPTANSISFSNDLYILEVYQTFLPLVEKQSGETLLSPIQALDGFTPTKNWTVTRSNLPDVLLGLVANGQLNGRRMPTFLHYGNGHTREFINLDKLVSDFWFEVVSSFLGVTDWPRHRLALLLDSLSYGFRRRLFPTTSDYPSDPCPGTLRGEDPCGDANTASIPLLCQEYCRAVGSNLTRTLRRRMSQLLMVGGDILELPFGELQLCHHPKGDLLWGADCWRKVINEEGVCYSTALGK